MSFFFEKKHVFLNCFYLLILAKKEQTREKQNKQEEQIRFVDLKRHFFQLKTKCRLSHCRETQEIHKKLKKHTFCFLFFIFVLFLVISCHFFHFLHFPSLENNMTNPDHLHVDPLSFADVEQLFLSDLCYPWSGHRLVVALLVGSSR